MVSYVRRLALDTVDSLLVLLLRDASMVKLLA